MDISDAVYLGQKGMITIGLVGGPILMIAMVVGILVSLFQAVTQLQEMTVVFVPKILAVFLLMGLLGPWMLQQLVDYGEFCFESIPETSQ